MRRKYEPPAVAWEARVDMKRKRLKVYRVTGKLPSLDAMDIERRTAVLRWIRDRLFNVTLEEIEGPSFPKGPRGRGGGGGVASTPPHTNGAAPYRQGPGRTEGVAKPPRSGQSARGAKRGRSR